MLEMLPGRPRAIQSPAVPGLESVSAERRGGAPVCPAEPHSAVGRGSAAGRSIPASRGGGSFGASRPACPFGGVGAVDGVGAVGAVGAAGAGPDFTPAGGPDSAGTAARLPVSTLPPSLPATDSASARLRGLPVLAGAAAPVSGRFRRPFVAPGATVGDASAASASPEAACVLSRLRFRPPLLPAADSASACLRALPVLAGAAVPVSERSGRSFAVSGVASGDASSSSELPETARAPSRPRFRLPPRRPRRFPRLVERERPSPP